MTNLFLNTSDVSAATPGGTEANRWRLGGSTGSAATARNCNKNGVAGPTAPLLVTNSTTAGTDGSTVAWYSDPLAAVTIAGQIVASLFGVESASTANIAPCIGVYACDSTGLVFATICDPATSGSQGALELATSAGAKTCTLTAAMVTDTALVNGNRLKVTLCIDDAADQGGSGSMTASGRSAQMTVNGATGCQIAFTETLLSISQPGFAAVAGRPTNPGREASSILSGF